MNHLLAKLNDKDDKIWKVISEEKPLYSFPDLSNTHVFDPSYKPDEDEWLCVENFTDHGFKNSVIGHELNTANYDQLAKNEFSKILYLCCTQENHILFQKITNSQVLKKKWFEISDSPSLHFDEPIIVLNNYLDAIYDIRNNTLFFRDLGRIKQLFTGIEELYREATQKEVDEFLSNEFITLKEGYAADNIKTQNRKRIALIKDHLSRLDVQKKCDLIRYAKQYMKDVPFENNSFVIGSETQLKNLLYAIDERYYKTEISGVKRLANSVQRIDSE